MKRRRILLLLVPVLVFPIVAACGGGSRSSAPRSRGPVTVSPNPPAPSPGGGTSGGTPLEQGRALWNGSGPDSYRFVITRPFYAPPPLTAPVVVEVRSGTVVSRTYEQTGLPVSPQYSSWWPDVEGLFAIIDDARARNAASIQVQYDPTLGFPLWANIDYDTSLADEEVAFSVRDFRSL